MGLKMGLKLALAVWEQILPLSISFLICETEIKCTYVVGFCHLWLIFTNIHWILFPITHFISFQWMYSKIGLTRSRPWDKIYMEVICKGILREETYNRVVEMPKGKEPSKAWFQRVVSAWNHRVTQSLSHIPVFIPTWIMDKRVYSSTNQSVTKDCPMDGGAW